MSRAIETSTVRATRRLGATLAEELARKPLPLPHAAVVALEGPLGAGKTAFAQGFARALGVRRNLTSPTFVFVRRYPLKERRYQNLYHVDAYRIRNASRKTLASLGLIEALRDPANVFLVEWADNIRRALPRPRIVVELRHKANKSSRTDRSYRSITFRAL